MSWLLSDASRAAGGRRAGVKNKAAGTGELLLRLCLPCGPSPEAGGAYRRGWAAAACSSAVARRCPAQCVAAKPAAMGNPQRGKRTARKNKAFKKGCAA
jgi:hypothetical protein